MSFHLWIVASSRTVCRVFGSCRTSGATLSTDQCAAADSSPSLVICPVSRLHGQMPEPVEEGFSVVGTGDAIIESGEDSERSPRQRTLRRPLPQQSLF